VSSQIEVWRSTDRFVTEHAPGMTTKHLLSFGTHYDPSRIAVGPLIAHNDESVAPGCGFADHRHRDVEIVTWVVSGRLRHRDSAGHMHLVAAGGVQVLSAGAGVVHSEDNAEDRSTGEPVRFIQSWLRPDDLDGPPSFASQHIDDTTLARGLVRVASGATGGDAVLRLRSAGSTLLAGRLEPGVRRELPAGGLTHLFVVDGALRIVHRGARLETGDSMIARDVAPPIQVVADVASTILVWQFDADAR